MLTLNEQRLEYVCTYKYLGVCIDNKLSFKQHVNQIIRNVSHKVYTLSKIRDRLTDKAAADVLKVMILPIIDYGDVFYLSASSQLLNRLRVLLNKAMRIVAKTGGRENTDAIAKRLNIQPLEDRRLCHLLQLARWMSLTGKCPDTRSLSTRSHAEMRKNMGVEAPKKSLFLKSYVYRACNHWNDLPTNLHLITDDDTFQRAIRTYVDQRRAGISASEKGISASEKGSENENRGMK